MVRLERRSWRSPAESMSEGNEHELLGEEHRAADKAAGLLYHHRDHEGLPSFHVANSSIRRLLVDRLTAKLLMQVAGQVDWSVPEMWLTRKEVHPASDSRLSALLHQLSKARITAADVSLRGSQLKLNLTLAGGQQVLFKPQWYDRDWTVLGEPYAGHDRHNAEIVAFHLNRLLGFNRVPLAAGRRLHLTKEILPVASPRLNSTVFRRNGAWCFYGQCPYCRGPETGICSRGHKDPAVMEGVVILLLNPSMTLHRYRSPWQRTYVNGRPAMWERYRGYCERVVLKKPGYAQGRLLLDLMDAAVFDYLLGNADRHHYETLGAEQDSAMLLLDNGKALGNSLTDERSILTPLTQCCLLRKSTMLRLEALSSRGLMTAALKRLLREDDLEMYGDEDVKQRVLLPEEHASAMERRLETVMLTVRRCVQRRGSAAVLQSETL